MEGPLSKWTNVMKGWQYRWFVLDDSAGLLSYYTSKDKMVRGARRGCVRLRNAVVGIDDDDDSTFTITVDAKTFHFQAHDADERETWIRALEDTILRHALAMTRRWDPSRPPPTMADFDKKLTESDGYLQLLIDQSHQLEQVSSCDDDDRRRGLLVLGRLNTLLETVKHSIVLLQIAKNTAFPANGVYQPCNAAPDTSSMLVRHGGSGGNSSDDGVTKSAVLPHSSGNSSTSGHIAVKRAPNIPLTNSPVPYHHQGGATASSPGCLLPNSSPTQRRLVRISPYGSGGGSGGRQPDDGDADSDDPVGFMSEQVQTGIEFGREAVCGSTSNQAIVGPTSIKRVRQQSGAGGAPAKASANSKQLLRCSTSVPETSYSSSEDEDFFDADYFDADEVAVGGPKVFDEPPAEVVTAGGSSSQALLSERDGAPSYSATQQYDRSAVVSRPPAPDPSLLPPAPAPLGNTDRSNSSVGGVDYDAVYEDEDEEDAVSMESHGFIIQHLLSQVKIGMDLTKVVLPTFILERRSLLEMYADFFAHPDLFCSISEGADPRARMVACVKWYLSAFHAGRKSEVAKKPYNPIIGELFRCHWDVPGSSSVGGGGGAGVPQDAGKPMPWVADTQLAFVAEQVSHHPPISAFYAENVSKRISFCGHIWTKSKFLGLSVCVYNIGQGCVSLLDHDEEYILNFPSGYGRSILTVPWVELGGSCQITCSRTGYSANVEFLTKPFYGGKKHRMSAEVFNPGEKKPFLTVDGEWNGNMTAKWQSDGHTESFVDTRSMAIVSKKVRPIADQLVNESRTLWKECTAALKFNNIEAATDAKFALEQRQREEAKQRKEAGEAWQTKLFSLHGENWIYHSPLVNRPV